MDVSEAISQRQIRERSITQHATFSGTDILLIFLILVVLYGRFWER